MSDQRRGLALATKGFMPVDEGEALSFIFENFNSVMHEENLIVRLRLFNAELDDRKR